MTIHSTRPSQRQNKKRALGFILDPKIVQGVKNGDHYSNIELLRFFNGFVRSQLRVNGYYPGHDQEDAGRKLI